jgi:hypothetical protein
MDVKKINYLKAGFTVLLAVYGIVCASDVASGSALDRVNLVAHEAGHLLFSYLGQFIMVLGGTIGQLLVPTAFTVYFYMRKEFYSSAVTLFWTGQNFFGISLYVKDARAMALPLVSVGGGEDTIHDWNYILSKLGLLRWDQVIGNMIFLWGIVIIIISILWGFYNSIDREESGEGSV